MMINHDALPAKRPQCPLATCPQWQGTEGRYEPWQTIHDPAERLCDRLLERLHSHLDEQGQIGWDVWCVDGTNIRATRLPPPVVEGGLMSWTIMPLRLRSGLVSKIDLVTDGTGRAHRGSILQAQAGRTR